MKNPKGLILMASVLLASCGGGGSSVHVATPVSTLTPDFSLVVTNNPLLKTRTPLPLGILSDLGNTQQGQSFDVPLTAFATGGFNSVVSFGNLSSWITLSVPSIVPTVAGAPLTAHIVTPATIDTKLIIPTQVADIGAGVAGQPAKFYGIYFHASSFYLALPVNSDGISAFTDTLGHGAHVVQTTFTVTSMGGFAGKVNLSVVPVAPATGTDQVSLPQNADMSIVPGATSIDVPANGTSAPVTLTLTCSANAVGYYVYQLVGTTGKVTFRIDLHNEVLPEGNCVENGIPIQCP